jgi:hypothetical protein
MDKNLNLIATELFDKIRTQFPKIKIGDRDSKVTDEPEKARFYNFDYIESGKNLGNINVSISDDDGLVVMFSNDIVGDQQSFTKKNFFKFLKELREFAKQKMMKFDVRDISKSNLEKRDYEYLSNNIGEGKMTESKLFGTSKTSYQQFGESKIIVKHSAPVNYESPTGRTQRIENIYIESSQGERFRYPFKHLNGARALAQHINHGGTPYDSMGQYVIGLSEEMNKLRMFKGYVDRNPVIAENIGSIRNKVVERIEQVKKEIMDLQHPSKYETFSESFAEPKSVEIPEATMNDWIDRLTIKTFNEELKNVFPYIFRLVDESDIPVKELGVEDLLSDSIMSDQNAVVSKDIPELAEYESFMNRLVGEATDIFSDDDQVQQAAVEKLNQLVSAPFPVGVDGTNAVESLSGIIEDDELNDIFKELADISAETDVRDILKDYIKIKDEENGTDILSSITFGEEEAGMDGTPEPVQPAPAPEPAVEPTAEPAPEEQPVTAGLEPAIEGNAFAQAVQKAKSAGMKPGDKFKVGEKEYTLQDAIEMAGMQIEDFFGNKEHKMSSDLIEFVKSMYNMEEGSFPKGETGVLIAVEKKFGESAVPMAQKVIGKLQQLGEMSRMKKLAGL